MGSRNFLIFVALLGLTLRAFAQYPTGTWTGETSGEGGLAVRPITLVLKADGTGTLETDVVMDLEQVSIDGNDVAFEVRPIIAGNPAGFRFRYEGKVEGDTMTLNVMLKGGAGGGGRGVDAEPLALTRELPAGASPRQ